jgi:hypothetical protein
MPSRRAAFKPVAVARARVIRATGETETHYSAEQVPIWQLRRWWKLRRHLAFMKREDRQWP